MDVVPRKLTSTTEQVVPPAPLGQQPPQQPSTQPPPAPRETIASTQNPEPGNLNIFYKINAEIKEIEKLINLESVFKAIRDLKNVLITSDDEKIVDLQL